MSDSDILSPLPLDYQSPNETNDESDDSDLSDWTIITMENLLMTAAVIAIQAMHIFCNRVDDVTDGIHELNESEIWDEIRIAMNFRMSQVCFYLNLHVEK